MATEYQLGQFMLVASYSSTTETQHFSKIGEQRTLCGINRHGWMVMRAAVPDDVESAYTCSRCVNALAKAA